MTRWTMVGWAVIAMLGVGCGGSPSGATCPSDSTLTYDSFGRQFMQTHCTSCHGSGGRSPNLSTQDGVRSNRQQIDETAAAGPNGVNTTMPESGAVPEAERRRLGEWLACGAP